MKEARSIRATCLVASCVLGVREQTQAFGPQYLDECHCGLRSVERFIVEKGHRDNAGDLRTCGQWPGCHAECSRYRRSPCVKGGFEVTCGTHDSPGLVARRLNHCVGVWIDATPQDRLHSSRQTRQIFVQIRTLPSYNERFPSKGRSLPEGSKR